MDSLITNSPLDSWFGRDENLGKRELREKVFFHRKIKNVSGDFDTYHIEMPIETKRAVAQMENKMAETYKIW